MEMVRNTKQNILGLLNIKDTSNYVVDFFVEYYDEREKKRLHPLNEYYRDQERFYQEWVLWNTGRKRYNVGERIIALVQWGINTWLLTGILEVTEDLHKLNATGYKGRVLEEYQEFYGKTLINFTKDFSGVVGSLAKIGEKLDVAAEQAELCDYPEFDGYENVRLNWHQLEAIEKKGDAVYFKNLANVKAVYLIVDTKNGKQYIGSATDNLEGLWSRWGWYVDNGHGKNVALQELYEKEGFEYIKKNFEYSILATFSMDEDNSVVTQAESLWKEKLHTREFGYNRN